MTTLAITNPSSQFQHHSNIIFRTLVGYLRRDNIEKLSVCMIRSMIYYWIKVWNNRSKIKKVDIQVPRVNMKSCEIVVKWSFVMEYSFAWYKSDLSRKMRLLYQKFCPSFLKIDTSDPTNFTIPYPMFTKSITIFEIY